MKYKILLVVLMITMIPVVSASVDHLGWFKINEPIELKQTCAINGTFCDFCNISSVDHPDSNPIIQDVIMTKRVGDFNYTLNSSFVNISGEYTVNGYCRENNVLKNWVYKLNVNPLGIKPTLEKTQTIGLSVWLFFILGIAFFVGFIFAPNLPFKVTLIVAASYFFLIALNIVNVSISDEVLNPNLESSELLLFK